MEFCTALTQRRTTRDYIHRSAELFARVREPQLTADDLQMLFTQMKYGIVEALYGDKGREALPTKERPDLPSCAPRVWCLFLVLDISAACRLS